jgi:hypothetical protein
LVGENGKIQYAVTADTPPSGADVRITSRAWASADRESPISAPAVLVVNYDTLPPPPPAPTTLYKTANKETYLPGDTINYTIAYKNTHGYPVKSTSRSQWTGTGQTNVSNNGDTINLTGKDAIDVRFAASSGVNGTITGTIHTTPYMDSSFYITVRDGAARIGFEHKYAGVIVTVSPRGGTPNTETIAVPQEPASLDFKIIFRADTLLLWVNDTSAVMPYMVHTGIAAQSGTAGVRFSGTNWGDYRVTGWFSHFDVAYNVTIRDTIPFGVSYINGSATGQINTGKYAPRTLTGVVDTDNVIAWTRVDTLGAGDSLTVTWKGVVDTAKNRTIINTAYANVRGYPADSLGAQLRSRFALDSADIVEPPDTADIDTGKVPQAGLYVQASPAGGIFTKQMAVTLSSPVSGADIYYTVNGRTPDPDWEILSTYNYDGQPLALDASFASAGVVTLMAVAYADGYEPSEVITHYYEPLRTVPVSSAIFYDDVGDGLAHGIKLVLSADRRQEPNEAAIKRHLDLLELSSGLPAIDSLRFAGDTVIIFLRGAGVAPPLDARLTVREPPLPDSRYTSEHGYFAERGLAIDDGVAPVITRAGYRRSESEGVSGDTLVVWFNKYAEVTDRTGEIAPFTLSYGQGAYKYGLTLKYDGRGDSNSVYFLVLGISGDARQDGELVQRGDSIRINAANGYISNFDSRFVQRNELNRAVPLSVLEPEVVYEYDVTMGPSPFRVPGDSLRIWVSMKQRSGGAFEALGDNTEVRIFDRMGNIVAMTGKNLFIRRDGQGGERYLLAWNGANRNGRLAATGTYVVRAVLTDPNGKKHTFTNKVYLRSR